VMVSPSFSSPAVTSLTALTDRPISIVPTAKLYRLSEQSVAFANDAVDYRRPDGLGMVFSKIEENSYRSGVKLKTSPKRLNRKNKRLQLTVVIVILSTTLDFKFKDAS